MMNQYETKEQIYVDEVLSALDTVAKKNIFFELIRLEWQERLAKSKTQNLLEKLSKKISILKHK